MVGINTYSTTAASNTNANTGINWDEGMNAAAVNNSARQNMADTRSAFNDLIWFRYGDGDGPDSGVAYASSTSFTVAGVDVTAAYHKGRRVKAVASTPGTIYGTITASSFSTNTTVTVSWDSGSLSNEAVTIYLSQVPVTGSPISDVRFRAYRSADVLTFTGDGTAYTCALDSVTYNKGGAFDTANNRFTAPSNGVLEGTFCISLVDASSGSWALARGVISGSTFGDLTPDQFAPAASTGLTYTKSYSVRVVSGETVVLKDRSTTGGGGKTGTLNSGQNGTYWTGRFIPD